MKKVVVVGGNAAGMSAASQVKRQQPDWLVTVIERGPYISYGACGIPYHVEGLVSKLEYLITVTPEEAIEKRKLNLKLNQEVTEIDPRKKEIAFSSSAGIENEQFDYLLIATGAGPIRSGIDYTTSKRIYTVHTLDDSENLQRFILQENPQKCAVIGGGYIAIEMLEALAGRGLETHLIHRRDELVRSFEKELSDLTLAEMKKEGIVLNLNFPVSRLVEKEEKVEVQSNGKALSYDLVIVATGVAPNSALAKNCGILTGVKDSIKVNEYLQTNYPHIYAAGDCVETKNIVTGKPVYVPLALKANKEGVAAGINISGGREAFPGILGTAITKFRNLGLARTGLTLSEAEQEGFSAIKYSLEAGSKAHYYPGSGMLTAVLVAEKKKGRLLGAQLAGPVDAVKRIDVYATALAAGMNLNDIFQLDLSYAPPFSPVYDPVVLTGRVGRKKIEA